MTHFGDLFAEAAAVTGDVGTLGESGLARRVENLIEAARGGVEVPSCGDGYYGGRWQATGYHGTTFRSCLEAHWAAFLTKLGARWTYEPKRYQMPKQPPYTPDFYLADLHTMIEVKPKPLPVEQWAAKYATYARWLVRGRHCRLFVLAVGRPREEAQHQAWWRAGERHVSFESLYGDQRVREAALSIRAALLSDEGGA